MARRKRKSDVPKYVTQYNMDELDWDAKERVLTTKLRHDDRGDKGMLYITVSVKGTRETRMFYYTHKISDYMMRYDEGNNTGQIVKNGIRLMVKR